MITNTPMSTAGTGPASGLRYALIPVHGYGIAVATVARMLDPDGTGAVARVLQTGEPVPWGARPVLLAETTVYGAVCVERMLQGWSLARPWLVLVADAPVRPAPAARFRFRALQARLAGTAHLPYLPGLRTAEGPEEAMEFKDVCAAAVKLRERIEGK